MIQIIRKRQRIESVSYGLFFERRARHGSGFGFECDASGKLLGELTPLQQSSWNEANDLTLYYPGVVQTFRHSYVEPAVGRCHCRAEVMLSDPLNNECERCHRWYNMCGQEVIDPNSELARELLAEESSEY